MRAVGVASPWGGWRATEARLLEGATAIAPVTRFDVTGYPCRHAAQGAHGLWADDPRAALSLAALADAGGSAAVDDVLSSAVGVFWGSESGLARFRSAFELVEAVGRGARFDGAALSGVDPARLPGVRRELTSPASPALAVARAIEAAGPIVTISHACAAGASAIAEGLRAIQQGRCEVAVCGGVGADVDPLVLSGFGRLGVLSERGRCAPFDAGRDGFVLGEGAAVVVLAAARGDATIELRGAGRTLDAGSLTAPDRDGDGAARAIRAALRAGGLTPADVVHVEAHGTGTRLNDRAEALALHAALGEPVARAISVGAVKGAVGHWIAGAGAIGAVAAISALGRGAGYPIAGLATLDGECPVPGAGRVTPWRPDGAVALANSFGFGGANVALAFRRAA